MKLSGTEDTVPLFTEVLALVDGRVPLLIELKEEAGKYGVTEKTLEVLKSYSGEYIIESFNPLALGLIKKKRPDILRGMLSMNYMKEKKHRSLLYFLLQILVFNVVCRPDFVAYDHTDAKMTSLGLAKGIFGTPTFAWTVRSEEEAIAAREAGFDGIIFEGFVPSEGQSDSLELPKYVK